MKKLVFAVVLMTAGQQACMAQVGRTADGCQAPTYCPPNCSIPANNRSLDAAPRGTFVAPPQTGIMRGPRNGYVLGGLGFRIPEINIELPELRIGGMARTRENAEMGVTASRAPFVENRALEFNQVVPDDADPRAIDAVPRNVPPAPCTSEMERQLRDQLSAKENEIRRLNDRFARLESMIDRIADSQSREVAVRQPQPKRIVGASYVQEEAETVEQSPQPVLSTRFNRSAAPKASAPVKKPTVDSAESAPRNVGFSYLASEEPVADGLGVWKGEGKQPSSSKDGSGKRTSR